MTADLEVLFRGLPEGDRAAFLALGETVPFESGQVILSAGRSDWDIYVIEKGELSIWVGHALIGNLQSGQTIGTSALLFPQIQWSAVRSNTDGTLLKIQREAAMCFFESRAQRVFQQFCVNLFKVWVQVLRDRNTRIAQIQAQLLRGAQHRSNERYSILVVVDEAEILEAMSEFFGERYDVVTAQDGAEAIERAMTERPDLILLDLRMPKVDGYQVCRRLKTDPETGYIPIVMLTALDAADKVKGLIYGADESLTKPVDLELLDETVSRVLVKAYG
ncbi:MAG TPA: response regulator [Candidatus Latescibacteria bacterium]|nr:response regulator [Candidatus Latescibacterota bacterium]